LTQDFKDPRLVADLVLTDSLFQATGAAVEKELFRILCLSLIALKQVSWWISQISV